MDESILESLNKINKRREARVKLASNEVKDKEKLLRGELAERQKIGMALEAKTKDLDRSTAEYLKIKETTKAKGFEKLAAVREKDRACLALEAMIAELDAHIERIQLEFFAVWHQVAKTTLNDYERCRPGKVKLRVLSKLAARKEAECRVSQGGYPLHIQLEVETKDALTRLPLDSRFLDKHLPEIYRIIDEYRDLDFGRKFLHIRYLSVRGLQPEGVILTIKDRPPHPAGNFRKLSTPEIETKEKQDE